MAWLVSLGPNPEFLQAQLPQAFRQLEGAWDTVKSAVVAVLSVVPRMHKLALEGSSVAETAIVSHLLMPFTFCHPLKEIYIILKTSSSNTWVSQASLFSRESETLLRFITKLPQVPLNRAAPRGITGLTLFHL